jgi:hypothetical protein
VTDWAVTSVTGLGSCRSLCAELCGLAPTSAFLDVFLISTPTSSSLVFLACSLSSFDIQLIPILALHASLRIRMYIVLRTILPTILIRVIITSVATCLSSLSVRLLPSVYSVYPSLPPRQSLSPLPRQTGPTLLTNRPAMRSPAQQVGIVDFLRRAGAGVASVMLGNRLHALRRCSRFLCLSFSVSSTSSNLWD